MPLLWYFLCPGSPADFCCVYCCLSAVTLSRLGSSVSFGRYPTPRHSRLLAPMSHVFSSASRRIFRSSSGQLVLGARQRSTSPHIAAGARAHRRDGACAHHHGDAHCEQARLRAAAAAGARRGAHVGAVASVRLASLLEHCCFLHCVGCPHRRRRHSSVGRAGAPARSRQALLLGLAGRRRRRVRSVRECNRLWLGAQRHRQGLLALGSRGAGGASPDRGARVRVQDSAPGARLLLRPALPHSPRPRLRMRSLRSRRLVLRSLHSSPRPPATPISLLSAALLTPCSSLAAGVPRLLVRDLHSRGLAPLRPHRRAIRLELGRARRARRRCSAAVRSPCRSPSDEALQDGATALAAPTFCSAHHSPRRRCCRAPLRYLSCRTPPPLLARSTRPPRTRRWRRRCCTPL